MSSRPTRQAAELAYLEAFQVVSQCGGVAAAARVMGCSQPAVSYQLRRLEELLGARLLERSGRGVALTEEGKRLKAFADQVLSDLLDVKRQFATGLCQQPLRLGAASGFGRYVLMPAVHRLRKEQDGEPVDLRLQYEAADTVLERLEAGDYEAAFVYKKRISSSLVLKKVYEEEFVLVGNADLAAAATAAGLQRLATFEALPFVTYEECDYVFGRYFDSCFSSQPSRILSRSHFTDLEEVIEFACRGAGLSIVPLDSVAAASGELQVLRAGTGQRCPNPVYRVMRSTSKPRALLERLTDLVTESDPSAGRRSAVGRRANAH